MILEIADIEIISGREAEFEAAVQRAGPIFARARGCRSVELMRVLERAGTYRLLVRWDTVENHTLDFQKSEDFVAWRALVGEYFARIPGVVHAELAIGHPSLAAGP